MSQEAATQLTQGLGDTDPQLAQGAFAFLLPLLAPLFQDGTLGAAIPGHQAAVVQQQPEQAEVGEVVFVEQALEVDFQVSRAGHGRVVAQQAQHPAVAHQRPESVLLRVEIFLGQPLG